MLIPLSDVLGDGPVPNGVIHAGAHLGEEADAYAKAGIGQVLWIEANTDLIRPLSRHVSRFGHDVACALLAAEPAESVTFNVSNNGQSSSVLALGTHRTTYPDVQFVDVRDLPARTLDDVCAEHEAIGYEFLNMDLQGYELECLRGAEKVLDGLRWVYSEVNVEDVYVGCAQLEQLDEFLAERGFRRRAISMAGAAGWGDAFWTHD